MPHYCYIIFLPLLLLPLHTFAPAIAATVTACYCRYSPSPCGCVRDAAAIPDILICPLSPPSPFSPPSLLSQPTTARLDHLPSRGHHRRPLHPYSGPYHRWCCPSSSTSLSSLPPPGLLLGRVVRLLFHQKQARRHLVVNHVAGCYGRDGLAPC